MELLERFVPKNGVVDYNAMLRHYDNLPTKEPKLLLDLDASNQELGNTRQYILDNCTPDKNGKVTEQEIKKLLPAFTF